jgi:DNA (cytosine-5)-methyltransferase 1
MRVMTIPLSFQWTDHDASVTAENSDKYLKENELNIRKCIGEAVPTQIIIDISNKINKVLLDSINK